MPIRSACLSARRLVLAVTLSFGACLALIPCAGTSARAQAVPRPSEAATKRLETMLMELDRSAGTIAVEVGPRIITWGDIADAIRQLPPGVSGMPFPALYENAAVHLAQQAALALLAQRQNLDKDPVVARSIRAATDQVLADAELRHALAPNVAEAALHVMYDKNVAGKAGPEEVQARVMMVPTLEEADTLLTRLRNGDDFAGLARDFSKDGSAAAGGDLGYARLDMLNPLLGAVIFSMAPGQTTAYPVKVNNNWFIVRVEGRRQPPPPSFESVRPALEQDVIHLGVPELLKESGKVVPIQYYGLTGKTPDKLAK